jgi:hypothetical protein
LNSDIAKLNITIEELKRENDILNLKCQEASDQVEKDSLLISELRFMIDSVISGF